MSNNLVHLPYNSSFEVAKRLTTFFHYGHMFFASRNKEKRMQAIDLMLSLANMDDLDRQVFKPLTGLVRLSCLGHDDPRGKA